MTCNKCGNALPENVGFCPFCGTRFEDNAAPQEGYIQPVYQPENAGQTYAPPTQEAQPQYDIPVQHAPLVAEKPEAPKKKKKSVVGIVLTVVAVILVVGLAALNVLQYLKASATAEELADANKQIAQMEDEAGELKEEISGIDAELSQLKGDYDAIAAAAADGEEIIAEYEDQIAEQEGRIAELEGTNDSLEAALSESEAKLGRSGAAVDFYDQILAFVDSENANGYRAHSHFYAGTNLVVVRVGQTAVIDITYTDHGEDNPDAKAVFEWGSWMVNVESPGFTGTVCPISVTGINAGVTTIKFTNTMDDATFEIMVVVVE